MIVSSNPMPTAGNKSLDGTWVVVYIYHMDGVYHIYPLRTSLSHIIAWKINVDVVWQRLKSRAFQHPFYGD